VRPALGEHRVEHGGAGAPGGEIAAVLLEDRPAYALAVDLRVTFRRLRPAQLLEPCPGLLENGEGGLLIGVVVLDQPEHTDRMEQVALPAPLVLLPKRECAQREVRVDGARPVGGADHPGLSPRAGARVAGPPSVDQGHARPPPREIQRGPAAERPGPHHDDVRFLLHGNDAFDEREGRRRGAGLEKRAPRDTTHGKRKRAPQASRTARRNVSSSPTCRFVSAAPMPTMAVRARIVSEYPKNRSSPVINSFSG